MVNEETRLLVPRGTGLQRHNSSSQKTNMKTNIQSHDLPLRFRKEPTMNIRLKTVAVAAVGAAFFVMPGPAQAQSNYEPYSFATFAGFPPGSANGTGPGAQ